MIVDAYINDALIGLSVIAVSGALLWWGLTYKGGAK